MRRPATPSRFVRVDGFDLRILFVGLNLYRIAALSLRRSARPQERPATELTNGVYSALTWHEHLQNEAIVRELMDWRSSRLVDCSSRLLEAPLEESHG